MLTNIRLFKKLERKFAIFRWAVLLIMAPILIPLSEYHEDTIYLIIVVILGSIYNVIITIVAYGKNKRFLPLLKYTMYFDIPLISIFVFVRGGLRSDTYLLYFLIILYDGAKFGFKGTINSLIQSIFYYTIAFLFFTEAEYYSLNRFVIRVVYLITLTFVMYEVNKLISESHAKARIARELAYKDPLTNLPNRLLMSEKFEELRNESIQIGNKFSVVMMDIDDFKHVNDTLGHAVGDYVLQTLAEIFKKNISNDDFICRFGGEEFLAFLKNDVKDKVQQIQKDVKQTNFKGRTISLSIGIKNFDDKYTMIENISLADEALYNAKNTGKNKIIKYDDLGD